MKFVLSICVVFVLCLTACNKKEAVFVTPIPVVPAITNIVTDVHGYKYRMISHEVKYSNGISKAELWERIDPLETNHWYTISLGSQFDTNNPPIFNSLMR